MKLKLKLNVHVKMLSFMDFPWKEVFNLAKGEAICQTDDTKFPDPSGQNWLKSVSLIIYDR